MNTIITMLLAAIISTVSGRVMRNNEDSARVEPLSFATVALIAPDNNVTAGTTSAYDGTFVLKSVEEGTYTLSVSFVGYVETRTEVTVNGNNDDLGDIVLQPDRKMLESATITERIPIVEQKFDKLVMNVSQLPSAQGSNALDMLRKAPGVYVDKDGNVMLNGSQVAIWIDGRPSNLSGETLETLLKATDATTIDKFEIMEHPSAKYDAEGSGGIINIKTKKNFLKGLYGSVGANAGGSIYDKKLHPDANGNVNLNYRTDRNSISFTYSPSYNSGSNIIYDKVLFGDGYNSVNETNSLLKDYRLNNVAKFGDDYKLSPKDALGASVTATLASEKTLCDPTDNVSVTSTDGTELYKTFSSLNDTSKSSFLTANAYYTHTFNEATGQDLSLNFDYSHYDSNDDYFVNNYVGPASATDVTGLIPVEQVNLNNQVINIYSAKADYSTLLFNKVKCETGLKWATTGTNNLSSENEVRNDFDYNETIAAGYVNLSTAFGRKWMLQGGLRYEHTFSTGDWVSLGTETSKNYGHLFPNILITFMPSKWRFTLNYAQRVSRPSFSQLNPSSLIVDAHTSIVGNPNLDPQISNSLYFNVGYSQFLNMTAFLNSTDDMITQVLTVGDDGYQNYKWDNFGKMNLSGLSLNFTQLPITKWLSLTVNVAGLYFESTSEKVVAGNEYVNSRFCVNASGSMDFVLPKGITATIDAFGMSKFAYAQYIIDPMFSSGFAIKKSIMNDKGMISLNVSDIFGTMKSNLSYYDTDYSTAPISRIEQKFPGQRRIMLGFTWKFGAGKSSSHRTHQATEEEKRINTNAGGVNNAGGM